MNITLTLTLITFLQGMSRPLPLQLTRVKCKCSPNDVKLYLLIEQRSTLTLDKLQKVCLKRL